MKDGQIVLNIVPHAVHQLLISNDAITFSARFALITGSQPHVDRIFSGDV
ncbi:ClpXP protease specificity-enhancing factor SspB [Klebsiella pneumoniae]